MKEDDWRLRYVGRTGWFEFLNRSFGCDAFHIVRFSDTEEMTERKWSLQTSEVININEDEQGAAFTTMNSVYRFELHPATKKRDETEEMHLQQKGQV